MVEMLENMMKYYSERNAILVNQMSMVRNSKDHESAVNAAKEAFKLLDEQCGDPFAPDPIQILEGVRKAG